MYLPFLAHQYQRFSEREGPGIEVVELTKFTGIRREIFKFRDSGDPGSIQEPEFPPLKENQVKRPPKYTGTLFGGESTRYIAHKDLDLM